MGFTRVLLASASGWLALSGITAAAGSAETVPPIPLKSVDFGTWNGVRYRITGGPDWLVADDDYVYVRRDVGLVDILDPVTGAIVRTADIGIFCQGIGAGFGAVWTCVESDVVPIDPETAEVGAPIVASKSAEQGHLDISRRSSWAIYA